MPSEEPRPSLCAEPGCAAPAGYRTRTKPAWCDEHITAILRQGGLEPLEPFSGPKSWRLTRCLKCGCEAHYRFGYTLDKNAISELTCRACYWRGWAVEARRLQGIYADVTPTSPGEARKFAEEHGYDYLGPLTDPSLRDDPHHTRCRYCGKLSAERLGDIGFGCTCQTNAKRKADAPSAITGKPKRLLLKESDSVAATWWDHDANDPAAWATVTVAARREVAWRCPECHLAFTARVLDMTRSATCPACEVRHQAAWSALLERYAETAVADVPELAGAWADDDDPRTVPVSGTWQLRRFECPRGHHPRLSPLTYLLSGCPSCRGQATLAGRLAVAEMGPLAMTMSPEIAAQWHPTRNGSRAPETVSPGSRQVFWWQDSRCGHEWQETPANREKGQRLRCPECRTILDSLAQHFPDLAKEWSPRNPLTAWQVRPSGTTRFIPEWICADDPEHTWQASLTSRSNGSGCPQCRVHGKSRVELDQYEYAMTAFANASSGRAVRHPAFTRRPAWLVDILGALPDGQEVVIEYDGGYWHANKRDVDIAKSLDLLAAGYLVARLREHPLPPLGIAHPRYAEFVVYSAAPDPVEAIERVRMWAVQAPALMA